MVSKGISITALLVMTIQFFSGQTPAMAVTMGTAFTYQGRFNASGDPATGAYDFQFMLYDAATAGNQVGSTVTKEDLDVNDGYFTTTLDFTATPFDGNARWLQIGVRPGAETGAYTILTPRHELTPTPYALNSHNLGTTDYISKFTSTGLANSVIFESSSGNIGIGNAAPTYKLQVTGGDIKFDGSGSRNVYVTRTSGTNLQLAATSTSQGGYLRTTTSSPLNLGTNATDRIVISNTGNVNVNAGQLYVQQSSGNIGVGTTSPSEKVHVSGGYTAMGIDTTTIPMVIRETDQTLPLGVWRVVTDGGTYRLDRNTAATGDFAAYMTSFMVAANGMTVLVDGNTGIGSTYPVEKLDVNGNVRCVDVIETSDEQLKTDVQPLDGVLDKLDRVRAVSFRWNEKGQSLGASGDTRRIGVLAQEVEQVFPEMVTTPKSATVDEVLRNYPKEGLTPEMQARLQSDAEKTQYKGVSYSQLTAVLLEAVKELDARNKALEQRIQALESKAQ